jgi:outer membrane protein OmpA-like peptidoglycan-associated protein
VVVIRLSENFVIDLLAHYSVIDVLALNKYLIEEGVITDKRLTKIGYGESSPATYESAPKNLYSPAAKSNMRVLFEIVLE